MVLRIRDIHSYRTHELRATFFAHFFLHSIFFFFVAPNSRVRSLQKYFALSKISKLWKCFLFSLLFVFSSKQMLEFLGKRCSTRTALNPCWCRKCRVGGYSIGRPTQPGMVVGGITPYNWLLLVGDITPSLPRYYLVPEISLIGRIAILITSVHTILCFDVYHNLC